ncbi:lytic transglycosylase domain-containing protein [Sphingomonas sp. Y38-1Y]|uniref:lytic transglycosylase domain-containing protein n=1 Tax=Sphingomonas sp. Y38-1Y TaxID=3078265 RepID=UPI0028E3686D|nr:lytic transglycosylase domain-containing protein [Sphingomonas sp. Y38-1Y]
MNMRAAAAADIPMTSSPHSAIAEASRRTGIDFSYLLGQAQIESGMRAGARARTSSATGLYQFIEQSWLGVMKEHGAEHGMGWAADRIQRGSNGRYYVADAGTRQTILGLRSDPRAASLMAAEHAADNKAELENQLGREATGTDLYMAHFLGIGGAKKFLGAMQAAPDRTAASMFPAAARANRTIFYAEGGRPRSLGEIYDRFAGKLDRGAEMASRALPDGMQLAQADTSPRIPGLDVILGNEAEGGDDTWLETTLANLNVVRGRSPAGERTASAASAYRPTPETARLAYLMLARLGA